MRLAKRTKLAAFVLLPLTLTLVTATADRASANLVIPFNYRVNATTHLKKLNQTVTVPPGSFVGGIDIDDGTLTGSITLPPAVIKVKLAGIALPVTATVKIVQVKPVTGVVDEAAGFPWPVTATATFNIKVVSAYATGVPVNLVGNNCTTATPVSVTMKGIATVGTPATFSGPYTIPNLKTCGTATTALNLVIPGPGNTFTAVATPK